jgi:hypothetical protein
MYERKNESIDTDDFISKNEIGRKTRLCPTLQLVDEHE